MTVHLLFAQGCLSYLFAAIGSVDIYFFRYVSIWAYTDTYVDAQEA
jgi:hypothetical protein|tara:strand:+ start:323 stop:460 length:138 start_codon:yes stop_codon:yes gene_type:complete